MSSAMPGSTFGLLRSVAGLVGRGKFWVAGGAIAGAAIALLIASQTHRVYAAQMLLQPVANRSAGLGGMLAQVGGLGSLVGLGFGADDGPNSYLAALRGPAFTARFIEKRQLAPLLAADKWDAQSQAWVGPAPTASELVRKFDSEIRTVAEDRRTGLVTVRVNWHDPAQAAGILNWMVADLNSELRNQALAEHQRSIDFLQQEAQRTNSLELRQTIYGLMESHLKQIVLANVRSDFALRIIDGPLVPTERDYVWPRRLLMVAVGLIVGGMIGLLLALVAAGGRSQRIPGAQ